MLNASYEPLKVVNWKKAFVLWFQGKVEVLEHHDQIVRSFAESFQVPSVIRLKTYVRLGIYPKIRFCRENIYRRDGHTCQYCTKRFSARELTMDHVTPASRGGSKSWLNIVTACKKCNQKKGNKTPEEARMPLLNRPREPKWQISQQLDIEIHFARAPDKWKSYLFFSAPGKTVI